MTELQCMPIVSVTIIDDNTSAVVSILLLLNHRNMDYTEYTTLNRCVQFPRL